MALQFINGNWGRTSGLPAFSPWALSFKKHPHFFKSSKGSDGDGRRGPNGGPVRVPYTEEGFHTLRGLGSSLTSGDVPRSKCVHCEGKGWTPQLNIRQKSNVSDHTVTSVLTCQISKTALPVTETKVAERDKSTRRMQNNRVYSAPVQAHSGVTQRLDHPAFVLGIFYTGQTSGSSELSC